MVRDDILSWTDPANECNFLAPPTISDCCTASETNTHKFAEINTQKFAEINTHKFAEINRMTTTLVLQCINWRREFH